MTTTNYEISKQLAEAGFETYTEFYYVADAKCISQGNDAEDYELVHMDCGYMQKLKYCFNYPAYDFETILEALPKLHDFFSRGVGKYELRIWYHEKKAFIGYQNFDGFDKRLTFEQEENESLADTAAKLWLKLKKEGLV